MFSMSCSLDKKLQAIFPGEYKPQTHNISDYTSSLHAHSRSLSEPSLSNPDELPQHLHTSFMADDLDTAGWREYRSSLSNSSPASPSTMPFDGFLSPTFDVASSELESMMPSHDTFLSESHSARLKPADGPRFVHLDPFARSVLGDTQSTRVGRRHQRPRRPCLLEPCNSVVCAPHLTTAMRSLAVLCVAQIAPRFVSRAQCGLQWLADVQPDHPRRTG